MEEKIFTATAKVETQAPKQCKFTSVTMVVPCYYLQMIWWDVLEKAYIRGHSDLAVLELDWIYKPTT